MAGMDAHLVTMLFVGLVVIATGLQLWLTRRQIRHVQQHRAAVPSAFSGSISLEAHQKAVKAEKEMAEKAEKEEKAVLETIAAKAAAAITPHRFSRTTGGLSRPRA